MFGACTDDFDDYNTPNTRLTIEETNSAIKGGYTIQSSILGIYHPNRYRFWRYNVIHAARFGGFFAFGNKTSWWSDGLSYDYSGSYTDASFDISAVTGSINPLLAREEGSPDLGVALIINAIHFAKASDTWGALPFNRAEDVSVYTSQKDIYKQILNDLSDAIKYIGSAETGFDAKHQGDPVYNGDLQKWKRLANSIRLKLALRSLGSEGNDFSDQVIKASLDLNEFILEGEDAGMNIPVGTSEWANSTYNGIWKTGGGGQWRLSNAFIDILQDNNDPRLGVLADTIEISKDTFELKRIATEGTDAFNNFADHVAEVLMILNKPTLDVNTLEITESSIKIEVIANSPTYIGQKVRYNSDIKPFLFGEFFSKPSKYIRSSNGAYDSEIMPTYIMTAAESFFYRSEAAHKGYGGDKVALFNKGLKAAMTQHGITDSPPSITFSEENLYNQMWLSTFGALSEGWSVARRTGYPKTIHTEGLSDSDKVIFHLGETLKGEFPQRMRYGSKESLDNKNNYDKAIQIQGEDKQNTKIWVFKK
jgi:hypothetical protein